MSTMLSSLRILKPSSVSEWIRENNGKPVSPDAKYPSVAEINVLPDGLRRYIHDLETNCDPSGTIRSQKICEDENRQLVAKIEYYQDQLILTRFLLFYMLEEFAKKIEPNRSEQKKHG